MFSIFRTARFSLLAALALFGGSLVTASSTQLASGPMLGHVTYTEARVWVQTDGPAEVRLHYRETEAQETHVTEPQQTSVGGGYSATLIADRVVASRTYLYWIEIDGVRQPRSETQVFRIPAFFRERQPPPDFRVVVLGRHYANDPAFDLPYRQLGGNFEIFEKVLDNQPDLVVWAGDTVVLREPDVGSPSGIHRRIASSRTVPELRGLLRGTPHYSVWGPLDLGLPGSDRLSSVRSWSEAAFRRFWPMPGREIGTTPPGSGLFTQFRWADIDFFLLDVNSFRDGPLPSGRSPSFLGDVQIDWLRSALIQSDAPFKVIIGGLPLLNPSRSTGIYSAFRQEHDRFLETLRQTRAPGLFFVSGGRPLGEFTRFVHSGSYDFHELSVGPVTAAASTFPDELNFFRLPGTMTAQNQFAVLDFTGGENRVLAIRVFGADGREVWSRSLSADSLRNP